MADQEVVIKVRQEKVGNAVAESEAEIKRLRAAADSYQAKDMPNAARSARYEAAGLQRELNRKQAETKIAAKDESGAQALNDRRQFFADELRAKEMRAAGDTKGAKALEAQNAIRTRAVQLEKELVLTRAEATAMATREASANAANSGGGGIFGGGRGVQAIGSFVTSGLQFYKQLRDDALGRSRASAEIARSGIEDTNAALRTSGFTGDKGQQEASAGLAGALSKAEKLKEQSGTFTGMDGGGWDQFKVGMKERFGFKSLLGQDLVTTGEQAEDEHGQKSALATNALALARKQAQQKFRDSSEMLEIEEKRARIEKDPARVFAIRDKILAQKEYKHVWDLTHDAGLANEAAGNAVFLEQQSRSQRWAGLVDGRSGASDVARAAALATGEIRGHRGDPAQILESMHKTMQGQHMEALGRMDREQFKPRWPRT